MLPCELNTPVYQVSHRWINKKHEWCIHILIFLTVEEIRRNAAKFGKSIFLNREDAENKIDCMLNENIEVKSNEDETDVK